MQNTPILPVGPRTSASLASRQRDKGAETQGLCLSGVGSCQILRDPATIVVSVPSNGSYEAVIAGLVLRMSRVFTKKLGKRERSRLHGQVKLPPSRLLARDVRTAELFYESQYRKWSDTALYAG